jgi:hypothetical protein
MKTYTFYVLVDGQWKYIGVAYTDSRVAEKDLLGRFRTYCKDYGCDGVYTVIDGKKTPKTTAIRRAA